MVVADKMNILYYGLDNPISVIARKYPCEALIATTNGGVITRNTDCHFSIRPMSYGVTTISLKQVLGKDTITITEAKFRVKEIPSPTAMIGGKHGGAMSANVLKAQFGVVADLLDFVFEGVCFEVKSFKLTLIKANGLVRVAATNAGPYFTQPMKDIIATAAAGDELLISDIRADGPMVKDQWLTSISLSIK